MNYVNLAPKIFRLKLLILDMDGVLSEGGIFITSSGENFRRFDVKDGLGLVVLRSLNIKTAIISGKRSEVVYRRAEELKFDYIIQGQPKKIPSYERLLEENGFKDENAGFIGDDLIDIDVMKRVGFSAVPCDAHPAVRREADYVCRKKGGQGAIREITDLIIAFRTAVFGAIDYIPKDLI